MFYAPDLLRAGLRSFRVELVDEPAEVVGPLLQGYRWVHGCLCVCVCAHQGCWCHGRLVVGCVKSCLLMQGHE